MQTAAFAIVSSIWSGSDLDFAVYVPNAWMMVNLISSTYFCT